jgi:hypothetical protein
LNIYTDYLNNNWHVIPLAPRTKDPIKGWHWTKQKINEHDCQSLFPKNNVAIVLGEASGGLVDIDLDWPEAQAIADHIIPSLPAFGRGQPPRGHRLAICKDNTKIEKFKLPSINDPRLPDEHGQCIAELRGTGGYTMFPPSIHPNGEIVRWENGYDPLPEKSWSELHRKVRVIAFLAVVVRFYPQRGTRDELCMALAGTLLKSEAMRGNVDAVDAAIELVASLAHDEEYRQREKAGATWRKMQNGDPATGFTKLIELLGLPPEAGKTMREWLGLGALQQDDRPIIDLSALSTREAIDRAEEALQAAGVKVFQRDKHLVRVVRYNKQKQPKGIQRHIGALCIEDVEPYWLAQKLEEVANFQRGEKPTKPTPAFCNHLIIGKRWEWDWDILRGIIETPTLRDDGTVLQQEGYDPVTGLYLDFGSAVFPTIPETPTREDARAALDQFIDVIRAFPFVPDDMGEEWTPSREQGRQASTARSVIQSAYLSGLIRRSLRTVPLHTIDAPVMGTGKGKLADIVSVILTGRCASVISQGANQEELEKRLFSMLYAGDSVVVIDNIERPLESSALCSILTQESWKSRILGKSETAELPTQALFMATGNNLVLRGDLTRRAVSCRLDAREERPDQRDFDFDCVALARSKRKELVVGGLTIIRAYLAAGRPLQGKIAHVGSFEDWTLIREVLVWLGQSDPAITRELVLKDDPAREELANVMAAWGEACRDNAMSIAEVKQRVESAKRDGGANQPMLSEVIALGEALQSISGGTEINVRKVGHWFKQNVSKFVNGQHFEKYGNKRHEWHYRLMTDNRKM